MTQHHSKTAIIIPARYGSTRFPGKPLAHIAGKSLIQRVWEISRAVQRVDAVIVATDDARIADHVTSFGGTVMMTPDSCRNGTERCYAAAMAMPITPDIIVNMQGDAALTPPSILQAVVDTLQQAPEDSFVTPALHLTPAAYDALLAMKALSPTSATTVTFDRQGYALYFSKNVIPYLRGRSIGSEYLPVYKHIGIYGYRLDTLKQYIALPATPFEQAEELEQLRALEHGLKIKVVLVSDQNRTLMSVDTPEDATQAEQVIRTEGELIP